VDEKTEMARVSFRGSFTLFLGITISNLVLAVGILVVANLLSPNDFGLYAVVLITPSLLFVFQGLGVNTAAVKFLAQNRAEGRKEEIGEIIITCIIFNILIGVFLAIICFAIADVTASNVFQRPNIAPLIRLSSALVFTNALTVAFQSVFYGFEKMEYSSFVMTSAAVLKGVLMPLFVILGYGLYGAILGNVLSNIVTVALGTPLLIWFYRSRAVPVRDLRFKENLKSMLRYGIPVSMAVIIGGFVSQFYNFILAVYSNDFLIGNYNTATNFSIIITFFTQPLATVLLPLFSRISSNADEDVIGTVFQVSVKYAAIVIIPITVLMMALSEPMVSVLYDGKYPLAPLYLTLLSATNLYVALGSLSMGNLMNGLGNTDMTLKLTILSAIVGVPLSLILIPTFRVVGLLITGLVATIPHLLTGLWWIKKKYGARIDSANSLKVYLSSGLAGIFAYAATSQMKYHPLINLFVGSFIFAGIFIFSSSVTGALRKDDLRTLIELGGELGPFSRIFRFILTIIQKALLH